MPHYNKMYFLTAGLVFSRFTKRSYKCLCHVGLFIHGMALPWQLKKTASRYGR